jgi:hypothetical protein
VENLLSWIPGAKSILQFVNLVISTALNFIDEAVLSYIFFHVEEDNAFKKACDGLSYYAQSWKNMVKGALKVGAVIWVFRIMTYLIFYALIYLIASAISAGSGGAVWLVPIIIAFVLLYGIEAIFIEPYACCIMINDYHKAIEGQEVKRDLYGTLCKVSGKFRDLFGRSGQPMPTE